MDCGYALNEGIDGVDCIRYKEETENPDCSYCRLKFAYNPDEAYEYWLETRYSDAMSTEQDYEDQCLQRF